MLRGGLAALGLPLLQGPDPGGRHTRPVLPGKFVSQVSLGASHVGAPTGSKEGACVSRVYVDLPSWTWFLLVPSGPGERLEATGFAVEFYEQELALEGKEM